MGLLELIIFLSILMLAMSVGLLLLKFVFVLILLPFKLMFALTKGLLGLVFLIPLLFIWVALLTAVVTLSLRFLILPIIVIGGITVSFRIRGMPRIKRVALNGERVDYYKTEDECSTHVFVELEAIKKDDTREIVAEF